MAEPDVVERLLDLEELQLLIDGAEPAGTVRMLHLLELVEPFELEPLEAAVRALAETMGVKAGDLFFPARVALTGRRVAPGIFEVMRLLGKRRTLERLRAGAEVWTTEHASLRQSS